MEYLVIKNKKGKTGMSAHEIIELVSGMEKVSCVMIEVGCEKGRAEMVRSIAEQMGKEIYWGSGINAPSPDLSPNGEA